MSLKNGKVSPEETYNKWQQTDNGTRNSSILVNWWRNIIVPSVLLLLCNEVALASFRNFTINFSFATKEKRNRIFYLGDKAVNGKHRRGTCEKTFECCSWDERLTRLNSALLTNCEKNWARHVSVWFSSFSIALTTAKRHFHPAPSESISHVVEKSQLAHKSTSFAIN